MTFSSFLIRRHEPHAAICGASLKALLLLTLWLAAVPSRAQTVDTGKEEAAMAHADSSRTAAKDLPTIDLLTTSPEISDFSRVPIYNGAWQELPHRFGQAPEPSLPPAFSYSVEPVSGLPANISAYAEEQFLPNLMYSRSAVFTQSYRLGRLSLDGSMLINRYETREATTQFGVSGSLSYRFSPRWSARVWGTYYLSNPYFSMATFPFVPTSSYGGWVQYRGETVGIKMGVQRRYDSFSRRWITEPIITPSFKLGKNFYLDLPVGPLVQETVRSLIHKNRKRGPVIMPGGF